MAKPVAIGSLLPLLERRDTWRAVLEPMLDDVSLVAAPHRGVARENRMRVLSECFPPPHEPVLLSGTTATFPLDRGFAWHVMWDSEPLHAVVEPDGAVVELGGYGQRPLLRWEHYVRIAPRDPRLVLLLLPLYGVNEYWEQYELIALRTRALQKLAGLTKPQATALGLHLTRTAPWRALPKRAQAAFARMLDAQPAAPKRKNKR